MAEFELLEGELPAAMQEPITEGFTRHTDEQQAPHYSKERINWLKRNEAGELIGALTGDLLWDWLYVDELWVSEEARGTGLGKELMLEAERYVSQQSLSGVWLWTQSWQAADFYQHLGYEEFTRFEDFPAGHSRIGFRKRL